MVRSISLLALLLTLVSCGKQGTTSAQLQVSRSFAVSSSGYGGGLIISGTSDTKQSFSVSVAGSLTTKVVLPKATWTINAVGWDGEAPFVGNPFCGVTTKQFTLNDETLDITLTADGCKGSHFITSSNQINTGVTPNTFKKLSTINTCGTFFKNVLPTDTIASALVNFGDDIYCDSVEADLKSLVKSIRISAINKAADSADFKIGLNSGCLTGSGSSSINLGSSNYRLPFKNVPFLIETFSGSNCTSLVMGYPFLQGIGSDYVSSFDKMLLNNSGAVKLWLPGNKTGRAKSPFFALLPYIKDSGENKFPVSPSAAFPFRAVLGLNKIVLNEASCGKLPSSESKITNLKCTDLGNKVQLSFTASSSGISWVKNTTVANVPIFIDANTAEQDRWNVLRIANEALGASNNSVPFTFFNPTQKISPNIAEGEYGTLSTIRYWLSAKGAGTYYQLDNYLAKNPTATFKKLCTDLVLEKSFEVYNPSTLKMDQMKVGISNVIKSQPNSFICNKANWFENDCATNGAPFQKRFYLMYMEISTTEAIMAMEFSCELAMGRIQLKNTVNSATDKKSIFNDIISWNTDWNAGLGSQRFEKLSQSIDQTFDGKSWTSVAVNRSVSRMTKSDDDVFEGLYLDYAATLVASTWNQKANSFRISNLNNLNQVCYSTPVHSSGSGSINSILSTATAPFPTRADSGFTMTDSYTGTTSICSSSFLLSLAELAPIDGTALVQLKSLGSNFEESFTRSLLNKVP